MVDIAGKIVLVTGASAGIGEAIARKFAEVGARLIVAARRADRLEKLAKDLGTECHVLELNVRDRKAVNDAIAGLPDPWREIDILVNNAGLSRGLDKLHEGNIDGWEDMIDTNVKGLLYMSRAVILGMVERGRGHIINIGSIAGHEVYPAGNVYCATKFAVDALTKGMRLDLVETPVRVSTVDPGLVETEFSEVRFYGDRDRAKTVYQGYKPLEGRDIAEAVVWVAARPQHVTVAQVTVLPTAQASATVVRKEQ
jgi:3-hydroxy acid dehydrogenase / malonic semialdehyde reductase